MNGGRKRFSWQVICKLLKTCLIRDSVHDTTLLAYSLRVAAVVGPRRIPPANYTETPEGLLETQAKDGRKYHANAVALRRLTPFPATLEKRLHRTHHRQGMLPELPCPSPAEWIGPHRPCSGLAYVSRHRSRILAIPCECVVQQVSTLATPIGVSPTADHVIIRANEPPSRRVYAPPDDEYPVRRANCRPRRAPGW